VIFWSITLHELVTTTIAFFGLGVTEKTAKPELFLAIGGNASFRVCFVPLASSCMKTMKHTSD
jgi:hypothetical protein